MIRNETNFRQGKKGESDREGGEQRDRAYVGS